MLLIVICKAMGCEAMINKAMVNKARANIGQHNLAPTSALQPPVEQTATALQRIAKALKNIPLHITLEFIPPLDPCKLN